LPWLGIPESSPSSRAYGGKATLLGLAAVISALAGLVAAFVHLLS
jgi:hypothetical protein